MVVAQQGVSGLRGNASDAMLYRHIPTDQLILAGCVLTSIGLLGSSNSCSKTATFTRRGPGLAWATTLPEYLYGIPFIAAVFMTGGRLPKPLMALPGPSPLERETRVLHARLLWVPLVPLVTNAIYGCLPCPEWGQRGHRGWGAH